MQVATDILIYLNQTSNYRIFLMWAIIVPSFLTIKDLYLYSMHVWYLKILLDGTTTGSQLFESLLLLAIIVIQTSPNKQ